MDDGTRTLSIDVVIEAWEKIFQLSFCSVSWNSCRAKVTSKRSTFIAGNARNRNIAPLKLALMGT